MKRKISLLLAAIMAMSVVVMPATEVQAANQVVGLPGTTVPSNTLYVERTVEAAQTLGLPGNVGSAAPANSPAEFGRGVVPYAIRAGYLEVPLTNNVIPGGTFRVELQNAEWLFNATGLTGAFNTTQAGLVSSLLVMRPTISNPGSLAGLNTWGIGWNPQPGVVAADTGLHRIGQAGVRRGATSPTINVTYDLDLGVFIPNTFADRGGTYVRVGGETTGWGVNERTTLQYFMNIDPVNPRIATVTVMADGNVGNSIRIPLVMRLTANEEIRIIVTPQGQNTFVAGSTHGFGAAAGVSTNAYVENPVTARDRFEIERLVIRELRANSIRRTAPGTGGFANANAFDIVLPSGFYFASNLADIRVGLIEGLAWGQANQFLVPIAPGEPGYIAPGNPGYPAMVSTMPTLPGPTGAGFGNPPTEGADAGNRAIGGAQHTIVGNGDFNVFFPTNDRATLRVRLNGFVESQAIAGSIWIDGLVVWADEDAAFDQDIEMRLQNTNQIGMGGGYFATQGTQTNTRAMITPQTIRAGTRADWNILLRTEGDVPQLISGRYESATSVPHVYHRTARVVFEEVVPNSWWAGRQVILALPEEVKWRRIEIIDALRVADTPNMMAAEHVYVNIAPNSDMHEGNRLGNNLNVWAVGGRGANVSHHGVRFDANRMYWTDILARRDVVNSHQRNARALIRFDAWVSIAVQFEGPITLTATGSGVSDCVVDNLPSVTIANAIPPVRVETVVTDTRIGFQYQQTSDIIITETVAGALIQDNANPRNVRISVTDFLAIDTLFSPGVQIELTEANGMRIGNITTSGLAGNLWSGTPTLGISTGGGTLSFDVLSRSHNEPAVITISNVSLRLDRTVPETNDRPYSVVVWGSAIARNFGDIANMGASLGLTGNDWPTWARTNNDRFANYPGIITDYIRVVTGGDGSPWLTQEVRVTIGELHYTVNSQPYPMDAAALLDPASDSTFVPLRFVANAFGLRDNQGIVWDGAARTATLVLPTGRVVQFTDGSTIMLDNGIPRNIVNANGMPIAPMMVPSGDGYVRMFLPFRFLGEEVLGVEVAWEAATQTAIFNPGGHVTN